MKKSHKSTIIVIIIILVLIATTGTVLYLKREQIFFRAEDVTPTPTESPTETPTESPTPTPTPTETETAAPTPTPTPTPTPPSGSSSRSKSKTTSTPVATATPDTSQNTNQNTNQSVVTEETPTNNSIPNIKKTTTPQPAPTPISAVTIPLSTPSPQTTSLSKLDLPVAPENVLTVEPQTKIAGLAVMPKLTLFLYLGIPILITGGLGFFWFYRRRKKVN